MHNWCHRARWIVPGRTQANPAGCEPCIMSINVLKGDHCLHYTLVGKGSVKIKKVSHFGLSENWLKRLTISAFASVFTGDCWVRLETVGGMTRLRTDTPLLYRMYTHKPSKPSITVSSMVDIVRTDLPTGYEFDVSIPDGCYAPLWESLGLIWTGGVNFELWHVQ